MGEASQAPTQEVWRSVPGFDGWYEVSNLGRVRSWRTRAKLCWRAEKPRLLKGGLNPDGYRIVKLTHAVLGKLVVVVHHLVLAAFIRPRPDGMVCDHLNANRADNRLENLRWVTPSENIAHAAELGRMDGRPGARSQSPLSIDDVREIRRLRQAGNKLQPIASLFGVSTSTISRIALGHGWKDVA